MNNDISLIILPLVVFLVLSLSGKYLSCSIKNFFKPLKKIKCTAINKVELTGVRGTSIHDINKSTKREYIVVFLTPNGHNIKEPISQNDYNNIKIGDSGFAYYKGKYFKGFSKVGN